MRMFGMGPLGSQEMRGQRENSVPIEHNFGGAMGSYRGSLYMLFIIGSVLKENQGIIKSLAYDSHVTHSFLKKIMIGDIDTLPMDDIAEVPWFGQLRLEPVPPHGLPRFPAQFVYDGGEAVWGLPGVCILP